MRSSFPRCVLLTTATAAVTFTVLQASFAQSTRIGLNFDGIGANEAFAANGGGYSPPDTDGAVGGQQIAEFINGGYKVWDKTTGSVVKNLVTDTQFWTAAGISSTTLSAGLSDTRLLYDWRNDRWFATEITTSSTNNQVLIGVSSSGDLASATWKATNFTGNSGFADYPTFSQDESALYIGLNNFTSDTDTGGSKSTTLFSLAKTDLLGATPNVANRGEFEHTFTGSGAEGFTLQAAQNSFGNGLGHGAIVAVDNNVFSRIDRYTVNNPGASAPTLSSPTAIAVQTTTSPNRVRQPDGTRSVDPGDDRISAAPVLYNGKIYLAHAITVSGSNAIRITVLNESTNAVVAEYTISTASTDFEYPSLAVNVNGDICMAYNKSSASLPIGSYARTGKIGADGTIVFDTSEITLAVGSGSYHDSTTLTNTSRWGDYATTVADPTNANSFWVFNEYSNGSTTGARWNTRITQVLVNQSAAAPEPGSIVLLLTGGIPFLGGFALRHRRRAAKA